MLLHKDVVKFLKDEEKNDRNSVRKVGRILKRLAEYGPENISNTEQFRHEGKYPTGGKTSEMIAIYAVKSNHIRIYGGFKNTKNDSSFFCVDAIKKKTQKANMNKLRSVAKTLGETDE